MRGWPWRVRWLAHRAGDRGVGVVLVAIGVAMAGGLATVLIYDPSWLTGTESGGQPGNESRSTTIRNVGLVGGGAIAILIAYWRSRLAQQDLLNKRYQDGAAMLGNDVLAVRLAGIYALERLAKDHPWEYHVQIMKLLCAFVRNPTADDEGEADAVREDVQAAMDAISACHAHQLRLEKQAKYRLDLHGAVLRVVSLPDADLSHGLLAGVKLSHANLRRSTLHRADLSDADLTRAMLINADLTEAMLISTALVSADMTASKLTDALLVRANLTGADLCNANVGGAEFIGANLTGTKFARSPHLIVGDPEITKATGLTQEQLDSARADPDNPPWLYDLVDPRTDPPEPLRPPSRPPP